MVGNHWKKIAAWLALPALATTALVAWLHIGTARPIQVGLGIDLPVIYGAVIDPSDKNSGDLFLEEHPDSRILVLQDTSNLTWTDPAFAIFSDALGASGRWTIINHKLKVADFAPAALTELMADRIDAGLRVEQTYKSVPGSQVFPGFAFSEGKLAEYLTASDHLDDLSEMMRGYEDNRSSVYYVVRVGEQRLLGRLDLSYVQDFLTQYSRFSGTPLLLVTNDGFVMLSGDPRLQIPAFELDAWAGGPSARQALVLGERRWIPLVSEPLAIAARVVTLIPTGMIGSMSWHASAPAFVPWPRPLATVSSRWSR